MRRTFLLLAVVGSCTTALLGCSYHLRQPPLLPFTELTVPKPSIESLERLPPTGSTWTEILQQELEIPTTIASSPHNWRLNVISDIKQKQIASLANDGTVREYRLYRYIKVQLLAPSNQHETFLPINIEVFRDLPYLESQRPAKELEETKLWADIETEIGQRIARRIIWQTEKKSH